MAETVKPPTEVTEVKPTPVGAAKVPATSGKTSSEVDKVLDSQKALAESFSILLRLMHQVPYLKDLSLNGPTDQAMSLNVIVEKNGTISILGNSPSFQVDIFRDGRVVQSGLDFEEAQIIQLVELIEKAEIERQDIENN